MSLCYVPPMHGTTSSRQLLRQVERVNKLRILELLAASDDEPAL